jgi:rhodanese-related sulfurtransferase
MEAGEDFVLIDVRNPQAWAESDSMLPEAIRVPMDKLEENLPRIPQEQTCSGVLHLTRRGRRHLV